MATKRDLAKRLLQELGVVGDGQVASDSDIEIAEQKLDAVHARLLALKKLRWTWDSIPAFAEEPYVLMGAYLAARIFGAVPDPALWQSGTALLDQANMAPISDAPTSAEYF